MLAESFRGRIIFFHVMDLYPLYAVAYADDFGVSVPLPPPAPEVMESEWQAFSCRVAAEESRLGKIH